MSFMDFFHFYDRIYNPNGMLIDVNQTDFKYNSIEILKRAKLVFTNTSKTEIDFPKAMMMRYVLHVIGDMH